MSGVRNGYSGAPPCLFQNDRDLPDAIRESTATRLFFSQGQVEQIREIQRTIVERTSRPVAQHVATVVRVSRRSPA